MTGASPEPSGPAGSAQSAGSARPAGSAQPAGSGPASAPIAGPGFSVVEYTDPACPWAWGSEPKFARLRELLGPAAAWRRVFGILFDETDDLPPDEAAAAAEAAWYHEELAEIATHTHAPYPETLAWVSASSWPASLACKAAQAQGPQVAEAVLARLRETTFVDGRPADTPERVLAALGGLPGLDLPALAEAAAGPEVLAAVRRDWAETRDPCREVLELREPGRHPGRAKPLGEDPSDGFRYALPTLVFQGPGGRAVVPGWRPLEEYLAAAAHVAAAPAEG
ncbi:MAG TPA: DsbA family protein [Actinocrinis sp.]|nr:DsbA family protein [Actinocrinis sp.]